MNCVGIGIGNHELRSQVLGLPEHSAHPPFIQIPLITPRTLCDKRFCSNMTTIMQYGGLEIQDGL
jgi:hypothetical protein